MDCRSSKTNYPIQNIRTRTKFRHRHKYKDSLKYKSFECQFKVAQCKIKHYPQSSRGLSITLALSLLFIAILSFICNTHQTVKTDLILQQSSTKLDGIEQLFGEPLESLQTLSSKAVTKTTPSTTSHYNAFPEHETARTNRFASPSGRRTRNATSRRSRSTSNNSIMNQNLYDLDKLTSASGPTSSRRVTRRSGNKRNALSNVKKSFVDQTPSSTSRQQTRRQRSNGLPKITADMNRKCALILERTYVRRLTTTNDIEADTNDPESVPVEPTGRTEQICISYDDVNKSIEEAKRRLNFKLTDDLMEAIQSIEPLPPFIAQLGELNQAVTKILTSKFDLSPDEILNGLPLIDMSRTNFWPICPLMVKPIQCDSTGRFRSFTGHCNNLDNPIWGAAQTPFVRYMEPKHPDGIEQERVSVLDGSALPAARLVTSQVHHDVDRPSSDLSLLIMVFGQFIDHDVAQAAPPRSK